MGATVGFCWGCHRVTVDREHADSAKLTSFTSFVSQHWICDHPLGFNIDCCEACGDLFLKWVSKNDEVRIRPAPGTCCPEMKFENGFCIGCGKKLYKQIKSKRI